jgi:hypothetical protein
MLTKDGIRTLANIVIVDLMRMNFFSQSCATQGFVVQCIQAKKKNYCDQHPID